MKDALVSRPPDLYECLLNVRYATCNERITRNFSSTYYLTNSCSGSRNLGT